MNESSLQTVSFTSSDITGGGDVDRVETVLGRINGVRDVHADTDNHTVQVTYDPDEVSENRLEEALIAEGYTLSGGRDDAGEGLPEGTGNPSTGDAV